MKTIKQRSDGFSDEERAAMKDRARELAAETRSNKDKAQGESDVIKAIAKMSEPDRAIAKRLHLLIKENAPELSTKTWYGFPAYTRNDKIFCFFTFAGKFKTRYATLSFSDQANLDEGHMWPVTYALTKLTASEEARIVELLKKGLS